MIYNEEEMNCCETCLQANKCASCANCKFKDARSTEDPCYSCEPGTDCCAWEAKE